MWRWEVWRVGECVLYKEGECNMEVRSMVCGRMCTV